MASGKTSRRAALAALGGVFAAPHVARADSKVLRWRMVTSWPKGRTGPGVSAKRIAERIGLMSGGRIEIALFGAGEIVPAFGVFDAVSTGAVELGHTASLYWGGKMPAAPLFTTSPFGFGPQEHQAWIELRGGQALWDALYAPHGLRAFLAGNTGPSMGGFFRRRISGPEDLKGLRIRVQGHGGDVYARLGATPVAVAPADLVPAFERGVVDAVEFLGPANDLELGLPRLAPFYYAPGFNKPNGASELLVSLKVWSSLPDDLRLIVETACRAEYGAGLADAANENAEALARIVSTHPVKVETFPRPVLQAAFAASRDLLSEIAASSDLARRIVESQRAADAALKPWAGLSADMAGAIARGAR